MEVSNKIYSSVSLKLWGICLEKCTYIQIVSSELCCYLDNVPNRWIWRV